MAPRSNHKPSDPPAADPATIPGFAKVVRALAHVPKSEVDESIAKERAAKKRRRAK